MYFEDMFINNLWNRIKDRVHGSVYCKIVDNVLIVKISNNGLRYEDRQHNIAWRIANGELNSKDHAAYIVKDYTQLIIRKTLNEYIK